MSRSRTPSSLARILNGAPSRSGRQAPSQPGPWRRETYRLPRDEARRTARDWLRRFPKAAYLTEIEAWRELEGGVIEFTMRRLPTAD